jgi:hypothetical protein
MAADKHALGSAIAGGAVAIAPIETLFDKKLLTLEESRTLLERSMRTVGLYAQTEESPADPSIPIEGVRYASPFTVPSMKTFLAVTFTLGVLFALAPCNGNAQAGATSNDVQSRKWLCVLEKAAGVMYNHGNPRGEAVNFEDGHKKFILTIKRIVRSQESRDLCLSTVAYWTSILSEKGTFSPSDKPSFGNGGDNYQDIIKRFHDYRYNIGPRCFASDEATVKFFDRDHADTLVSYDFLPQQFAGFLPGQWRR